MVVPLVLLTAGMMKMKKTRILLAPMPGKISHNSSREVVVNNSPPPSRFIYIVIVMREVIWKTESVMMRKLYVGMSNLF